MVTSNADDRKQTKNTNVIYVDQRKKKIQTRISSISSSTATVGSRRARKIGHLVTQIIIFEICFRISKDVRVPKSNASIIVWTSNDECRTYSVLSKEKPRSHLRSRFYNRNTIDKTIEIIILMIVVFKSEIVWYERCSPERFAVVGRVPN